MTDIAALIADMVKAGVDPDIIGRTAAALAEREPVLLPGKVDEVAERKRAADRERMRQKREVARQSSDLCDEVPPKKETSPTPPKEKTTPSQSVANATSQKRAARLSHDWSLPVDWHEDALAAGLPRDRIEIEARKMRDWSMSSPKGAKLDWRATWRNWARQAAENLPKARGSPSRQPIPRGSDHFDAYAEEISNGRAGNSRGDQGYRDDASGLPILTIEHHG